MVRLIKRVKIRVSKTQCLLTKSNRVTRSRLHSKGTTTYLAVVHCILCPLGRKEIWMDGWMSIGMDLLQNRVTCLSATREQQKVGMEYLTIGVQLHEVCCVLGGALVLVLRYRCGGICRNLKVIGLRWCWLLGERH